MGVQHCLWPLTCRKQSWETICRYAQDVPALITQSGSAKLAGMKYVQREVVAGAACVVQGRHMVGMGVEVLRVILLEDLYELEPAYLIMDGIWGNEVV
jgi:hypothetical protein